MNEFDITASDGARLQCYAWQPSGTPRATVQIAHGMGEHARRYEAVATALVGAGLAVYANDQRGHGATAPPGELGYMGPDGWNRVLSDAFELHLHIDREVPDVKRVLLGHSMGASMSQQFVTRHGAVLDALVLSGSPGIVTALRGSLVLLVARLEGRRLGINRESPLLQGTLFGSFNRPFDGPGATGAEWLSRDPHQVEAYVDDPLCGFVLKPHSLRDYFVGAGLAAGNEAIAKIPRSLPIYVFSGSEDPVHGRHRNLQRLIDAYRGAGLNVDYKLYPGGRHEMFNETNADEVVADVIRWLEEKL